VKLNRDVLEICRCRTQPKMISPFITRFLRESKSQIRRPIDSQTNRFIDASLNDFKSNNCVISAEQS